MSVCSRIRDVLLASVLATATLSACTTATPYQPDIAGQRVSGGYSEQRIGEALFGGVTRLILSESPIPVVLAH